MKLVVFTPEGSLLHESELLISLLDAGLESIHVRKPEWDLQQMRAYLSRIPDKYLSRVAVHSFSEYLAPEFGLRRLHFTQKQREAGNAFEWEILREKGFTLSTSVHSVPELEDCTPHFHRVFIGPVFNSISKKDYQGKTFPIFPQRRLAEVIGIGGVKNANLSTLQELGYDGGALLGWIWENTSETLARYKNIHSKWVLQGHTH